MGTYPPLAGAARTQQYELTRLHLLLIVTCTFCKLTDEYPSNDGPRIAVNLPREPTRLLHLAYAVRARDRRRLAADGRRPRDRPARRRDGLQHPDHRRDRHGQGVVR